MTNSTLIIASDGNFGPDIDGFVPPVAEGQRGWWWFDGDNASAPVNLVTKKKATVVGDPSYDGLSVGLGQGAYFITDLVETALSTHYFVASSTAALVGGPSWPGFIGNSDNATSSPGISILGYNGAAGVEAPAGTLLVRGYYDESGTPTNSPTASILPVANHAIPHLYSAEILPGIGRRVRDHTAGTAAEFVDTRARVLGTDFLKIGQFSTFSGVNRQWMQAVYDVQHTADQRNQIVDWIRKVLAGDGVTV